MISGLALLTVGGCSMMACRFQLGFEFANTSALDFNVARQCSLSPLRLSELPDERVVFRANVSELQA